MGQEIAAGRTDAASGTGRTGKLNAGQRRDFLDHLAATGSVEGAAAAVSILPLQAYAACQSDAGFAQGWRAALRVGYDRLEALLIERTGAVLAGTASGPLETPDVLFALRLIDRRREAEAPAERRGKPAGGRYVH